MVLLEPARWVLRLVLPCISQADPHLEPSLPAGGARVELSLWSSRQRRVTDHLAEGSDTKNEPVLSPRGLGAIYLPRDLPSSAGRRLAFRVSSTELRSATSTHCRAEGCELLGASLPAGDPAVE